MKRSLAMRAAGVASVAAVGLAACGSNGSSGIGTGGGGTVSLDPKGSTFQQAIEQQWAASFRAIATHVHVSYTGTGSLKGTKQFIQDDASFAGSDVTMTPEQQSAANSACGSTAISLPVTAGGVAVIYNVNGVPNLNLTAATLAKVLDHRITRWDDPEIHQENPGAKLPAENISVFYRKDGSGTTSVLWGFLEATARADWPLELDSADETVNWPAGHGATGSSGVVQGVKQTQGGITYAEASYAKQADLPTAAIKGVSGGYQNISPTTVTRSIQSGFTITGRGGDLAGTLSFTAMTGYPISTVSYVFVCSKYEDAATGAAVKKYLTYVAGPGQHEAAPLGFAPLPRLLAGKVQASVNAIS